MSMVVGEFLDKGLSCVFPFSFQCVDWLLMLQRMLKCLSN
jgi:hypothetical protein